MEVIINNVASHEMHSFINCFLEYYQVAMAVDDEDKINYSMKKKPF